ncbi:hypothetical protein BpHYR1_013957 [Brachionus plicatilis]|uniref:Uncharacterized protein n=1 Tax=Brachionus plicatilis TaxID=10195 RepID=A0A3M7R2T9_BRAPC|nr:hypothetical protein BpHYR1_013957 [Brachionus plicatilis]
MHLVTDHRKSCFQDMPKIKFSLSSLFVHLHKKTNRFCIELELLQNRLFDFLPQIQFIIHNQRTINANFGNSIDANEIRIF